MRSGGRLFQGPGQLIGAGGGLHAALDALDALDGLSCVHPLDQRSDSLQIAVAAALEADAGNLAVFDAEGDLPGTGAAGFITEHIITLSFHIHSFMIFPPDTIRRSCYQFLLKSTAFHKIAYAVEGGDAHDHPAGM